MTILDQLLNLSHSDDPDGSAQEGYPVHLRVLCEIYEQCNSGSDDAEPTTTQSESNTRIQHEVMNPSSSRYARRHYPS